MDRETNNGSDVSQAVPFRPLFCFVLKESKKSIGFVLFSECYPVIDIVHLLESGQPSLTCFSAMTVAELRYKCLYSIGGIILTVESHSARREGCPTADSFITNPALNGERPAKNRLRPNRALFV
jgi:hypothetical protein